VQCELGSERQRVRIFRPGASRKVSVLVCRLAGRAAGCGGCCSGTGTCGGAPGSPQLRCHSSEESQNHRMVGVGRDLCGSSSPTLPLKQGHLQQVVEDLVLCHELIW